MTKYALYNQKDNRAFRWPAHETLTFDTKEEAEQVFGDFLDYLEDTGMAHLKPNFTYLSVDQITSYL
jgi:hypothetical protein